MVPNADISPGLNALAQGLQQYRGNQRRNALELALPQAMAGDQAAQNRLLALDPNLGMQVQNNRAQQAEGRRTLIKDTLTQDALAMAHMTDEQLAQAFPQRAQRWLEQFPELQGKITPDFDQTVRPTILGLAGIKPGSDKQQQIPDVIEVAERYKADPDFRKFYDNSYRPQTFSGSTVVATPDGGYGIVQGGSRGGSNTIPLPGNPAQFDANVQARVAGAEAEARAAGAAKGESQAKAPAKASYSIAAGNMRKTIKSVSTGGELGLTGQLSRVTDYQGVREFNNRVQQLSTELRTVFRIPGEGTLTNQEQEQYNIQLPSIYNDPALNDQIMEDLDARIGARVPERPQAPDPAPSQPRNIQVDY